jgi:hypothetical protein
MQPHHCSLQAGVELRSCTGRQPFLDACQGAHELLRSIRGSSAASRGAQDGERIAQQLPRHGVAARQPLQQLHSRCVCYLHDMMQPFAVAPNGRLRQARHLWVISLHTMRDCLTGAKPIKEMQMQIQQSSKSAHACDWARVYDTLRP